MTDLVVLMDTLRQMVSDKCAKIAGWSSQTHIMMEEIFKDICNQVVNPLDVLKNFNEKLDIPSGKISQDLSSILEEIHSTKKHSNMKTLIEKELLGKIANFDRKNKFSEGNKKLAVILRSGTQHLKNLNLS